VRRFHLVRTVDRTGISGTGTVCEGVQFSDGRCVTRWISRVSSINQYLNVDDVIFVHGHDGDTVLRWVDAEPSGLNDG
jgi:hypothetical protein